VLGALMVGVVIAAGVELNNQESKWVRAVGVVMVVAAVLFVIGVLLTLWFLTVLCQDGCN
jgi:hypothetical protein